MQYDLSYMVYEVTNKGNYKWPKATNMKSIYKIELTMAEWGSRKIEVEGETLKQWRGKTVDTLVQNMALGCCIHETIMSKAINHDD